MNVKRLMKINLRSNMDYSIKYLNGLALYMAQFLFFLLLVVLLKCVLVMIILKE